MSIDLKLNQYFDPNRKRQYLDDILIVYHCHHYSTLFSQLADDAKLIKGPKLMVEASEETFYPVLNGMIKKNQISILDEKIELCEKYFSYIGMGTLKIKGDENSGTAEMEHSHVDEGWLKKWGKHDNPINFIGQGYISALFSAVFEKPIGYYKVDEIQSIVMGDKISKFNITKK